jgi:hypothetical protein
MNFRGEYDAVNARSQGAGRAFVIFIQKFDGTFRFITIILMFLASTQTTRRQFSAQAKMPHAHFQNRQSNIFLLCLSCLFPDIFFNNILSKLL